MSYNQDLSQFTVDELLIKEPKLVSDSRIKNILTSNQFFGKNPNPDKYSPCTIQFAHFPKSVLQSVLKNVTEFDYDQDKSTSSEGQIVGPLIVKHESSLYIGEFKGDIREGRGIQIFRDGCYYEGYFKDDSTNVKGRLIFGDGDMYLGQLVGNSMNGQGVYFKKDGSKYIGTFVDDAPEGKGREEWEDGAQFEGNYLKGCKHGYGVFKFANKTTYKGNFKEDLFWGQGTLVRENGIQYKGQWVEGILKSPATIVSPNGNSYTGEIKDMTQNGKGEYNDHGRIFIGNFKDGKPDGEVLIRNTDGTEQVAIYEKGAFKSWKTKPTKSKDEGDASKLKAQAPAQKRQPPKKKKGGFCLCGG